MKPPTGHAALLRAVGKMAWLALIARKSTRGFYDAFAQNYDALVAGQPNAKHIARFLGELIDGGSEPVDRLLDIGCGTGLYTKQVSALAARTFGLDFSFAQLREAERKSLPVHLLQADALMLPFPSSTFDVVTSYQVLPHLPGLEPRFFAEAYRVLSPGGLLLVDPTSALTTPAVRTKRYPTLGPLVRMTLLRATRITAWTRMPTAAELIDALETVGFTTELYERLYTRQWTFLVGRKPRGAAYT